MIDTPSVDWLALSPTLALLAVAGVTLLGAVLVPRASERAFSIAVSVAGFGASAVLAGWVFDRSPEPTAVVVESMTRDRLGALAAILIALVGLAVVLLSAGDGRRSHVGEYYALLAAAAAGMVFFVSAANLMTMFLALEWFSIALYVLCALDTHRRASLEAGLKYLIVGSFGSGILLFGCALVYGATGELGFSAIREATGADDPLFVTGMAMILAGLAFKVSAAPFHMWTPDVYQGAPTTVTAFMSAATKVAGLVLMLRILVTAFPEQAEIWSVAVAVLAVCSLAIGNFAAIAQRDVKRLLAYSSVSQAGFLLIAIAANSTAGAEALLYYLIPYSAASVGAFSVVAARERELRRPVTLGNLAGLGWERPFVGVCMWWFMLSMAGFPLTGGFLGKLFVFSAIYEAGWWWLVVIGVLATALSLAYYLNVVRSLYMRSGEAPAAGVVRRRRRLPAARPPARRHPGRGARGHDRLVLLRAAARRPRERRRRVAAVLGGCGSMDASSAEQRLWAAVRDWFEEPDGIRHAGPDVLFDGLSTEDVERARRFLSSAADPIDPTATVWDNVDARRCPLSLLWKGASELRSLAAPAFSCRYTGFTRTASSSRGWACSSTPMRSRSTGGSGRTTVGTPLPSRHSA